MPYSASTFDSTLAGHIYNIKPTSILDIGIGAGKNGKLIRQSGYIGKLDGVEPTQSYREYFDTASIYDTIYPMDLQTFVNTEYRFSYDTVIFGDVLEHFFRSQVIDYIDYFLYKCKWLIIIWPSNMPQHDWGNNHYEIHKSNFTINDLTQKFNVEFYAKQFMSFHNDDPHYADAYINYTVLKGHMTGRHESLYDFQHWNESLFDK